MTPRFDPRLYAIVDISGEDATLDSAGIEAALAGGVTLLQLRAKRLPARALFVCTRDLLRITSRHGVPLLVNDRADVAMAAGAQGVHLGRSDIPAGSVRLIWPEAIIGVSVHDTSELAVAHGIGVDYVAAGCLFPTVSKPDAVPLDHALFATICRTSRVPVVGIGGITANRAPDVVRLGAQGVAVIHGLWSARDPGARAAEYRRAVESAGQSPAVGGS